MSSLRLPFPATRPVIPVTPSAEEWRAMSPARREAFVQAAMDALNQELELAPEGRPHSVAKMKAATTLGDFFARIGKRIYLAADLMVLYPGEPAFAPDILAVLDMDDPVEQDRRSCWSVEDEGRGVDLALEVLYSGDRQKDLVSNVAFYARLGIREYFVYDRMKQRLYGWRLQGVGSGRYTSIQPQAFRLRSTVLDLDLGVVDERLRFFYGEAMVPETAELLGRLEAMMARKEAEIEAELAARAELERQRDAEAALRVAAESRAEAAQARAEALEAELAALKARLGG